MSEKVGCVLVAAGRGARAGFAGNKVLQKIGQKTVLERCVDALFRTGLIDEIVLVLSEDGFLSGYDCLPHITKTVHGGSTRQESALNGLKALSDDVEIAMVHDAARPFVTKEIVQAVLEDTRTYGTGIISTPVIDTIKQLNEDGSITTLNRASLRAVQTPQCFYKKNILLANQRALEDGFCGTDDASLYEHAFGSVHLSTAVGAENNIKLTVKEDFEAASLRF